MKININGLTNLATQNERDAFERACKTWESAILNQVTITVEVISHALGKGLSAVCIPNLVQSGKETYTTAQAKAIDRARGTKILNQGDDALGDMVIVIDPAGPYDFSTASPGTVTPNGEIHFETQALHEMCHGLGFLCLCNVVGNKGVFTDTTSINELSAAVGNVSIPLLDKIQGRRLTNGYKTLFAKLLSSSTHDIADPLECANLFSYGSLSINAQQKYNVVTDWANGGFTPFTSCDHLDYASGHCLMYGSTGSYIMTTPDDKTKDVLRAIGWSVN
ncbi:MAG TPA: hypothetical protein VKQ08_08190 [Cyclobacteriaceae bacterium]|nr:hypothetical protein [Cyclobacteriaceae bacterium]